MRRRRWPDFAERAPICFSPTEETVFGAVSLTFVKWVKSVSGRRENGRASRPSMVLGGVWQSRGGAARGRLVRPNRQTSMELAIVRRPRVARCALKKRPLRLDRRDAVMRVSTHSPAICNLPWWFDARRRRRGANFVDCTPWRASAPTCHPLGFLLLAGASSSNLCRGRRAASRRLVNAAHGHGKIGDQLGRALQRRRAWSLRKRRGDLCSLPYRPSDLELVPRDGDGAGAHGHAIEPTPSMAANRHAIEPTQLRKQPDIAVSVEQKT